MYFTHLRLANYTLALTNLNKETKKFMFGDNSKFFNKNMN